MKASLRMLCVVGVSLAWNRAPSESYAARLCDGPPSTIKPFLPALPKGCQQEPIRISGELTFNIFRKANRIAEAAWEHEARAKYGERFQELAFAACKTVVCAEGAVSGTERCVISAYACASDMDDVARGQVERLSAMEMTPTPTPTPDPTPSPAPPPPPKPALAEEPAPTPPEPEPEPVPPPPAPEIVRPAPPPPPQPVPAFQPPPAPLPPDDAPSQDEKEVEPAQQEKAQAPVDRDLTRKEVREMQRYLKRAGYNVFIDGIFGDQSRDALSDWERKAGLPDNGYPTFEMLERLRRDVK